MGQVLIAWSAPQHPMDQAPRQDNDKLLPSHLVFIHPSCGPFRVHQSLNCAGGQLARAAKCISLHGGSLVFATPLHHAAHFEQRDARINEGSKSKGTCCRRTPYSLYASTGRKIEMTILRGGWPDLTASGCDRCRSSYGKGP